MSYRLVVLNGQLVPPKCAADYREAFRHWRDVWKSTFLQLDGSQDLFSDNFTRQDEIYAVFEGDTCVAMTCLRFSDLSQEASRADSYFEAWPRSAVDGLAAHGPRVIIGNQISVAPDRRGPKDGIKLKDLMVTLTVYRVYQLGVDAMSGTMRVDKNMQDLLYVYGAVPLHKNVSFHGVSVDLVAIHPANGPLKMAPPMGALVERLWRERTGIQALDRIKLPFPERKTA